MRSSFRQLMNVGFMPLIVLAGCFSKPAKFESRHVRQDVEDYVRIIDEYQKPDSSEFIIKYEASSGGGSGYQVLVLYM